MSNHKQANTKGFWQRRRERAASYGRKIVGADDIQRNHDIIRESWGSLTNWKHRKVVEETFANAYARLNLSEQDLAQVYQQFVIRFYLFLGFATIDVFFIAWSLLDTKWMAILPGFGFLAICLVQMFIGSFRAYQIERRELVSANEWFNNGEAWWPPLKFGSVKASPKDGQDGQQSGNRLNNQSSQRGRKPEEPLMVARPRFGAGKHRKDS